VENVHTVGDAEALGVLARELDGLLVRVRRPHLDLRAVHRQRDGDGAAPGADVGDAHGHPVDALERGIDKAFGRRPRVEDTAGRRQQRQVVEGRFHKLPP
jgi:hypothetical protein